MNLKRRIEKAEKATGIEQEDDVPTIVISCECGGEDFIPHFSEPVEEWVTLRGPRRALAPAPSSDISCT